MHRFTTRLRRQDALLWYALDADCLTLLVEENRPYAHGPHLQPVPRPVNVAIRMDAGLDAGEIAATLHQLADEIAREELIIRNPNAEYFIERELLPTA